MQDTLDELNEINYFDTYHNAEQHNYGAMLDGLMKNTFELMREIAPTEIIWRMFALYYDIHNMKLVVKEKLSGKRLEHLALDYGSYALSTIRSASVRESDNILGNESLTQGFFDALRLKNMEDIDFILDKTYFRVLKELALSLGIPEIVEFVTERIDLFNVSALFQSVAAGSPNGYFAKAFSPEGNFPLTEWPAHIGGDGAVAKDAEKSPVWQKYRPIWANAESRKQLFYELDVLIDNYLIDKTKIALLIAFGIEPICAYFYNKFMEIKNMRILLTGKAHSYNTEEIKKRMRNPYEL